MAPSADVTIATQWQPYVFSLQRHCSYHLSEGFCLRPEGDTLQCPWTSGRSPSTLALQQICPRTRPVSQSRDEAARVSHDVLWYFQRWHTHHRGNLIWEISGMQPRHDSAKPLSEWSLGRRRHPGTSWWAFHGWRRSRGDGLQADCSLTLQTGTTWYHNNKDTPSLPWARKQCRASGRTVTEARGLWSDPVSVPNSGWIWVCDNLKFPVFNECCWWK